MTEETNLQLNKLVESIDGVSGQLELLAENASNPDWWSVVATIIAAIVAAWITYKLGKRQNELQQQQLKLQEQQNEIQKYQTKLQEEQIQQQEYDLYRRMYTRVFELDFFNKTILNRIVAILTSNEEKELRLRLVDDIWNEYEQHSKEFGECTIDMELKQCGEGLDAKYYYDALQASRRILLMFKYFINDELLIFNPSLAYNPQIEDHNTPPEVFIDMILRIYKGRNPHILKNELLAYASIVDKTKQTQLLKVIKDRITPTEMK
ncbi:MAG: hypothetical protein IJW88_06505 [Alistipes sp.]|nr:hypothetical protein [Alistipes sp.]